MKDVTDAFHSLGCWSSIGSFGFNTDILTTNPMNPSVVLFSFFFFFFFLFFCERKCVQVVYFKNSTLRSFRRIGIFLKSLLYCFIMLCSIRKPESQNNRNGLKKYRYNYIILISTNLGNKL